MNARTAAALLLVLVWVAACDSGVNWGLGGNAQVADPGAARDTGPPPDQSPRAVPPDDASPTPAATGKLVPFKVPRVEAGEERSASGCAIPGLVLPERFVVYAAGAYAGRKLDFQIDQSGSAATQIDVAVDEPSAPVVLMLGAYEPTVWNIGWSPRTRIAGVLVSGYHRQAIAGLPVSVPRLNSSYDNKGPCGYFYLSEKNLEKLNPLSRRMFRQSVARAFIARNGVVAVGTGEMSQLVTDSSQPPERYRDADAPLAGEAGLRDAVAKGLLREARSSDMQAWKEAYDIANRRDVPPVSGASASRSGGDYRLHNGYVVLKAMRIPAGLHGAHSAVFIVPKGVPRPTGDPGHSRILDYNTLTCAGVTCAME